MYCQFDFYLIVLQSLLTIDYIMSKKMSNKDNKNLESDQQNQKKIGQAESNPETPGPAESLRKEAAEMTDEGQDSKGPA
jgi:hypothetical protein